MRRCGRSAIFPVPVVFAYETPGEVGGAFTRCRAEGTSDGRGHAGDGEFTMFGTQDDGRIQVQVANGTTSSEVFYVSLD